MTYEEEVVVMNRAIKTYGVNAQIEQLMEESIELALACKKYLRHKGSPEKLQELKGEIADVGIMIDQFFQIFPESEQEVFGIM